MECSEERALSPLIAVPGQRAAFPVVRPLSRKLGHHLQPCDVAEGGHTQRQEVSSLATQLRHHANSTLGLTGREHPSFKRQFRGEHRPFLFIAYIDSQAALEGAWQNVQRQLGQAADSYLPTKTRQTFVHQSMPFRCDLATMAAVAQLQLLKLCPSSTASGHSAFNQRVARLRERSIVVQDLKGSALAVSHDADHTPARAAKQYAMRISTRHIARPRCFKTLTW